MQNFTNNQLQHSFLQQSCLDAWDEYERQIKNSRTIIWDYVVLTASNEEQANIYRSEIEYRLRLKQLPARTKYLVLPDPDGKRVGSGGATLNVLKAIAEREQRSNANFFKGLRVLVIHSGGDSKRIPQYSTCGKLFSPVPRVLPNGQASTLFDEFMVTTSMIPGRMQEGMMIMSGDVLLLFNALQIDPRFNGAAAISIKENVDTGKNHGVFLGDEKGNVKKFLHKQPVETLTGLGAVNRQNQVDLDTGAILMDSSMLQSLYSLISTDNKVDDVKFDEFVNEKARISFYGDFLYPLASDSTLEEYKKEAPEGDMCDELISCREKIWEVLKKYQLKLICLSPAEFIHFGTTGELRKLVTETVEEYTFLGWERVVGANCKQEEGTYALHNVFVQKDVKIGDGAYVENAYLAKGVVVEDMAVVSDIQIPENCVLRKNVVYHGLKLQNGKLVVRVYGVDDNPKGTLEKDGSFIGITLQTFMSAYDLRTEDIWDDEDHSLWKANIYPECDTMKECMEYAEVIIRMTMMEEVKSDMVETWKKVKKTSLYSSFNKADGSAIIPWRENLQEQIRVFGAG